MGYNTFFQIRSDDTLLNDDEHEVRITDFVSKKYGSIYSEHYNLFEEDCKWYDYDDHMREYSKQFPETLFELEGRGEALDDFWICYYKNGKAQHCQGYIDYETFDEEKLT